MVGFLYLILQTLIKCSENAMSKSQTLQEPLRSQTLDVQCGSIELSWDNELPIRWEVYAVEKRKSSNGTNGTVVSVVSPLVVVRGRVVDEEEKVLRKEQFVLSMKKVQVVPRSDQVEMKFVEVRQRRGGLSM